MLRHLAIYRLIHCPRLSLGGNNTEESLGTAQGGDCECHCVCGDIIYRSEASVIDLLLATLLVQVDNL